MSINKFRGGLYGLAKVLGDVQAGRKAAKKKSVKPITDRIMRRYAGKITGRFLGSLFK